MLPILTLKDLFFSLYVICMYVHDLSPLYLSLSLSEQKSLLATYCWFTKYLALV